MTCCTASVYGPSPSPTCWATCGRRAEPWGSTPRPSTAGSTSWTATAPRSCARGSGGTAHGQPHQPAGRAAGGRLRLGHPGFGPARIAAELARPTWGGILLSTMGVAGAAPSWAEHPRQARWPGGRLPGPPEPQRPTPPPERHLHLDHPGELVQLDCCCIGRLAGTKGTVWQSTAIDVASAYTWATLQVTRRNPSATWTSALARQVAADLAERGWKLERVMSDNASEFRSATFGQTSPSSVPSTASFELVGRRPMAASSGCSRRSWTNAGSRRSRAT
jgi:hypothetical protein